MSTEPLPLPVYVMLWLLGPKVICAASEEFASIKNPRAATEANRRDFMLVVSLLRLRLRETIVAYEATPVPTNQNNTLEDFTKARVKTADSG
jgi:hypothetical protein